MSGLLQSAGLSAAHSRQLASWNPYDQNASADFFDSEWMFGVFDGFDVVAGNPPYGRIVGGRNEDTVAARYADFRATRDAFVAFVLEGLNLSRKSGILAFIVPTAWLGGPSYRSFRGTLLKHSVEEIVMLPFDIWRRRCRCSVAFA